VICHSQRTAYTPARGDDDRADRRAAFAEAFFAQPEVGEEKCDVQFEKQDRRVDPRQRHEQHRQEDERRENRRADEPKPGIPAGDVWIPVERAPVARASDISV
jgi:hypothetical protein